MALDSIPEVKRSIATKDIQADASKKIIQPEGRKCIYQPEMKCTVPHCRLEICSRCPYGYIFATTYAVKSVYKKIIGIAILLADRIYKT